MARGLDALHLSVEGLSSAAAYTTSDGSILIANARFTQMWMRCVPDRGRTPVRPRSDPGELRGQPLFMLFAEEDRPTLRNALPAAPLPPTPSSHCAKSTAGTAMIVELVPAQHGANGRIVWLVMVRPASLAARSRSRVDESVLAAGVVHDLRTPIQVVLGWTALLKRDREDPGRVDHALALIERNGSVVLDLLDELMKVIRLSWVRSPRRSGARDLAELTRTIVSGLQPLAESRGVRLILRIEAPVPHVSGDDLHLRRILTNLLSNALRFTPRGGTVECTLSSAGAFANVVVRDTGRGITREFLPRVFDPFRQEARRGVPRDGTGLGLFVVRHLVELLGGFISVESAGPGEGTTFTVRLPAVRQPMAIGRSQRARSRAAS